MVWRPDPPRARSVVAVVLAASALAACGSHRSAGPGRSRAPSPPSTASGASAPGASSPPAAPPAGSPGASAGGPAGSAPDATGPCGAALAPPATYRHVVWIWMENHSYGSVIGSAQAPYQTQLVHECATV